jgi:alkylation response protein AidB-like acyl-CoA dehydrogenase
MVDFTPTERTQLTLQSIRRFVANVVRPKEEEIEAYLTDNRKYLDQDGKLHPVVMEARKEIHQKSAEAGFYALHLPEEVGGGGFTRSEMLFVEEEVYSHGVGLNPAILGWCDGPTPRLRYETGS